MHLPVTVRDSEGTEIRETEIDNTPGCAQNPRVRLDRQGSVSVGVGQGSYLNVDFKTGTVELSSTKGIPIN